MTKQLPPYEAHWGFPVKSGSLLNSEFQAVYAEATAWFEREFGVALSTDSIVKISEALDAISARDDFDVPLSWFVATQYWRQSSMSIVERNQLPIWWWEAVLNRLQTGARFEALAHVSEASFGQAMNEWVTDRAGIPLSMINHWRTKRTDAIGMIPKDTFFTLYEV